VLAIGLKAKTAEKGAEMKTQNMSLKWKIFMHLLAFCAVLLVVLWLYQIVFLDRFYRYVKIGEVRSSAAAIENNLERADFPQYLTQLAADRQVGIEVVTTSGSSRFTAGSIQESILPIMSNLEKVRLLQQAAENNGELMVYYNRDSFRESRQTGPMVHGRMAWLGQVPQNTILYARLVGDESGWQTAILISSRVAPVAATVNTLRIQFYYIAGLMVVLAVALALVLARRVASPIETITKRAQTLASGDYAANFSGGGYREIDDLAETLNYAANELSRVDHLRRELIANVSHDLRTPLTLISGYAEAMMDLPGEANPENARVIAEETQTAQRFGKRHAGHISPGVWSAADAAPTIQSHPHSG
jgi:methyl-accepting chemotaxis protein